MTKKSSGGRPFPGPYNQATSPMWMKERAPHTSRLVRACGANKNLLWIQIPTPKSGYLVALYSTHVVRLVGPPHLTKHLREEVLPDLQHLLLHARLHLTLLVHLRNRSPHLRHILLLLLILFPILWWLIQRAGAPTVPAPASTLAPFGLEDHQVPSNSL